MRTFAAIVLFTLVGCAKPQFDEGPAIVESATGLTQPVEVAPAPWEVPSDQQTAARFRWHRESVKPLLRALAIREIRAGDDIAALIARHRSAGYSGTAYGPT